MHAKGNKNEADPQKQSETHNQIPKLERTCSFISRIASACCWYRMKAARWSQKREDRKNKMTIGRDDDGDDVALKNF